MKTFFFIALAVLVFQKRADIQNYFDPPPDYSQSHGGKVILYATSWCGYCKKTREFLTEKRIPFHEYDIEKSAEGKEQYRRLGGQGVPVLLVKGSVIKGFYPEKILENLQQP